MDGRVKPGHEDSIERCALFWMAGSSPAMRIWGWERVVLDGRVEPGHEGHGSFANGRVGTGHEEWGF